ncbi:hypothetical protein PS9374_07056 [Planomonospora sphaerica]|uniref:Uncharacterized protein n=1 Tax=Planomonospora sphaerica TaxID=161355 RepID=A0A171DQM4_9ACTN|nr:hypothetical protein [Planomonospora sphaerica]GAT71365.1 hypothetical protein PS9374_07056 [Planomonospora sphaerica]
MNPYRRRALVAVLAVSALLGVLAMGSALWWGGNRHPLTAVPQIALLLLGFWVIDRTRTFADPTRLRELRILVRTMPASAHSGGRDGVLLWRVQRRKRSAIICRLSQAALAEAELAAGQPFSTVGYDVFSIKEYTISRYHGSYILTPATGGAWQFSSPYRHTRRSSLREMMFAVKTGAAYVTDTDIAELTIQLRRAQPRR